ncbi:unnamed protein product, partial [Allacma fusca]
LDESGVEDQWGANRAKKGWLGNGDWSSGADEGWLGNGDWGSGTDEGWLSDG